MKQHFRVTAMAMTAILAATASADPRALQDIIHGGFFNSTFGVYLLGETAPSTASTTSPTRDAGSYAVSPNAQALFDGTNQFYFAGVSDGFTDTSTGSGVNGKQDLLGFTVNLDPSNYGIIDVTRRRIANAEGTATNSVNQFGVNSVANDGTIALKMTIGTGNSNGFGTISATNTSLVVFGTAGSSTSSINEYTPSSGTGYTLLGASGTATFNVPSIGANTGIIVNANFNKQVTASAPSYTGGAYLATTKVLGTIAAGSTDNRGSITYNDQAGLAAVLRLKQTATTGSTAITHVTAVAIYKITFDANGNPELRDLQGNLSTLGTEVPLPTNVGTNGNGKRLDLVGTNYFSRSAFVGPVQIAMNDNGDIALATVAVDVTDTSDTGQNQERGSGTDRRILVSKFNPSSSSYGTWLTAAQSGQNSQATTGGNVVETPGTGDFVSVNPVSSVNSIAIGNPSIDNADNVYFTAATEAVIFGTGGTTLHTALFHVPTSGIGYSPVERVLEEGDTIEDPNDLTDRTVTYIPLSVATSDLTNANIRYPSANCFNPGSALHDIGGGMTFACRLSDGSGDTSAPTRWNFLYIPYR